MTTSNVHDIRNTRAAAQPQAPREPDSSLAIAAHLAKTRYEDLPAGVVDAAKASILDTIACVYAGTACDDVIAIRGLTRKWGGRASSTVIGSGGEKVPTANAVLANGSTVHQFDFDDTHDTAVMHPTSASLIPALAVAEDVGGVSGKTVITAVALANDLSSRVGLATRGRMWDHPWFRAPVIGIFGATAAAAKVYGASAEQHLNALGLTLPQVSGTWASLHHKGSSVRSIRDGLAYRDGVLAAELAMAGIRGDAEVFDGPYGFYRAFFRGDYDRATLLDGLGERYETTRVSLKPWPCIRHLHTALTAVLGIMERERLMFEDIAEVMLHLGQVSIDRCRPVALGSVPANHIDLAGNMHFAIATAIRHRGIPLAVYHDPKLADEIVVQAMPKVKWTYDARFDGRTLEASAVEIVTTRRERHRDEHEVALGHPDNPMSREQQLAKFLDCTCAAATPLPRAKAMEIAETVSRLEALDDIGALMKLLA
ncbi:MAG TPA: MmgE/PrpD family protein [Burkholderiales bacterium]|nr:MmgE/PrpD family protein [Burkholderiales bacterium]